jgi:hypothetical protein
MLAPVQAPPFCTPDIIERSWRYGTIRDTGRAHEARSKLHDRGETFAKLSIHLPGSELHESCIILLMDLGVLKFQALLASLAGPARIGRNADAFRKLSNPRHAIA